MLLIPGTTDPAHIALDAERMAELDALANERPTRATDENRRGTTFDMPNVDFESLYRGEPAFGGASLERMPWDIDEPQPLLVELKQDGGITGRVLDDRHRNGARPSAASRPISESPT